MVRKIGSFFVVWFGVLQTLFSMQCLAQDVGARLYALDTNETPVRQVAVQDPFIVQLVVDNMVDAQQPDHIPGFESCKVVKGGTSQSTSFVNGKRTSRMMFNYVVRADTTGTLTFGPVAVQDKDGNKVTSTQARVVVGDETVTYHTKTQPFVLQVIADHREVYVGQKVNLVMKFYSMQPYNDLRVSQPQIDGLHLVRTLDQTRSTGTLHGQEYNVDQWIFECYPEKEGRVVVTPQQATFFAESGFDSFGRSSSFAGVFDFWGMSSERRIQSHAFMLSVKPLPEHAGFENVTAVGQFEKVSFQLQKESADVGEGVIGKLVVHGTGNLDVCKASKLVMPQGLKYYESNSSVDHAGVKTFEFVIQAEQGGSFVIPEQTFAYFDPEQKTYHSLQSNSVTLQITAQPEFEASDAKDVAQDNVDGSSISNSKLYQFKKGQIDTVVESGMIHKIQETGLLHTLMTWLTMLLLIVILGLVVYWVYVWFVQKSLLQQYHVVWFTTWYTARRAYNEKDLYGLYRLLEQHFQALSIQVASQNVELYLQQVGVSSKQVDAWRLFFDDLHHAMYAGEQVNHNVREKILQQGRYWATFLVTLQKRKSKRDKVQV